MNKKQILGISIFILLFALMAILSATFRKNPVAGMKSITIEVINLTEESVVYELNTNAEFLEQAMTEAGITYAGEEGPYGLMIHTINNEYADFIQTGSYWSFYVNGDYCNYGIAEQPVLDGDVFQIINTKAE